MSSSAITGPILSDVRRAPAGTAAAPSFAFNDSTGTGVYLVSAGVLGLSTAGVQRVVVDASGNVGIGTASPGGAAGTTLAINGAAGQARLAIKNNTTGDTSSDGLQLGVDTDGVAFIEQRENNALLFSTNATARMRIDASGRLLVGYTSTGPWPTGSIGTVGFIGKAGATGVLNTAGNVFNINWTGSAAQLWIDTTNNGTISLTSDYRVKKNIETQSQPALERIAKLRPVKYEFADYKELFRADGVQREGFIAHELQEVIPSAVEGEKDAENQIQSLKLDALCSVMVKAMQEQQEIIKSLEARLAALESK